MNCSNGKPIPKPLSPKDKDSFAFPTMKDRVPVIICKVIDLLYRDRASLNLTQPDDLKNVIEGMSKLRYEIVTNKKLSPITDGSSDAEVWNEFLTRLKEENENQDPTWFGSRWLSVECFVYRRLLESMKQSSELATYDFFAKQKREAFYGSLPGNVQNTYYSAVPNCHVVTAIYLEVKIGQKWANSCNFM